MKSEKRNHSFEELIIQLRRQGFETTCSEDGSLLVNWHGTRLCQVMANGGLRYELGQHADCTNTQTHSRVYSIVHTIAEYMALMETAPQIKASSLEGDYRALAEYNGVVLAGHPTRYGVQFVTWEWVQDHTALWQGHYTESYTAAKEDFATRSGLVPKERLFSDQQLAEVYRCIHETLDNEYPLTEERRKLLTQTAEQIQWAVPSLDELIQKSNEKELTQGQMYDPSMTQQI